MLASLLVALFVTLSVNAAIGPVADLPIVNSNIAPDGYNRPTVLAGGTFPGPLIRALKDEEFKINVQDRLTDGSMRKSTSIHWHGLFQKNNNWADGGAFVSQCPIAPNNDFLYQFKATGQAGTFWYHSHYSTQYCDGLRGPLVIYDPLDLNKLLYDVDDDNTVITLADWYHNVSTRQTIPAVSQSTLINGKGRYPGGPLVPLSVINVQNGKRYRFRIVSISCDANYQFSIEGHDMTIIAIDGINTVPKVVDQIQVFAGQRYDVVVKANQPVGNYHVRALPPPDIAPAGFDNGVNSAILRYAGAPDAEPTFSTGTASKPLVEKDLKPQNLLTWPAPGLPKVDGADVNINLNLGVIFAPTFNFTVNGRPYQSPDVPILLQILNGAKPETLLPQGLVIPLPRDKSVQISMPATVIGGIGGPHPFHLHGHAFHVVRAAGQSDYNWINPPQRDVVSTGLAGDNVTIRFKTDNPGPWFLHCHIDWHLEEGLAVVFAEDVSGTRQEVKPPPAWDALCPAYNALDPSDQ